LMSDGAALENQWVTCGGLAFGDVMAWA